MWLLLQLLWTAASQGDVEGVTLALMDGADINTRRGDFNNTPLLAAAREGYHAVVVELLNNTLGVVADVNATDKNNASALFISSQYGHTDVVKELIDHYASVDFPRAGFNDTPLFIASQNGHVNVVRELLASTRADVNRRDNDSNTALHVASEKGQLSVVQVLLQNGADPNMTNSLGNTPLHYACAVIGGNGENVVNETALVAKDVNVTANDGSTPLIWASWFGNPRSAELLLKFNASKELKTNDGKTAFDQICGCLEDADKEGVIKCPEGGCEENVRNQTRERLEMALAL